MYINAENIASCQRKPTCTFIYIYKAKELQNVYIYTKARHFAKSKTISVTFLFTKIWTLYVTQFFKKFLKLAFIYIQKA